MRKLTIIRGLPGSGKSTLAQTLSATTGGTSFEADQFFIGPNGVYEFDRSKLKQAHADCLLRTKMHLEVGGHAIVANTFTTAWELRPYLDLAKSMGITPQIIECQNNYGSVHNVPGKTYKDMRERFEHDISDHIPVNKESLRRFVENSPGLVKLKTYKNGLSVLKYTRKVFYDGLWNPYLEHCRGAVVDNEFNPVSLPLIKIYNYGIESEAPVLDPQTKVTAFRKVNGFMICATWYNDDLLLSTTGTLDSDYVGYAREVIETQGAMSGLIEVCRTSPHKSFVFECVSPHDPHIIPETPGIYLLAVRTKDWDSKPKADPLELQRLCEIIGIDPVEHYEVTLEKLLAMAKTCTHEGFVFYTRQGQSSKLKSPYYLVSKWLARSPSTEKILSAQFKSNADEEFYPLIEHIRGNISNFEGLSEQQRLQYIRNYYYDRI